MPVNRRPCRPIEGGRGLRPLVCDILEAASIQLAGFFGGYIAYRLVDPSGSQGASYVLSLTLIVGGTFFIISRAFSPFQRRSKFLSGFRGDLLIGGVLIALGLFI